MNSRSHFVYRAFDADGRLLYIGCTKNLEQRRRAHAGPHGSLWFPYAASYRITGPYEKATALQIEKAAIEGECSFFNGTAEDRRVWLHWSRERSRVYARLRGDFQIIGPDGLIIADEHDRLTAAVDCETLKRATAPDFAEGRLRRYLEHVRSGQLARAA